MCLSGGLKEFQRGQKALEGPKLYSGTKSPRVARRATQLSAGASRREGGESYRSMNKLPFNSTPHEISQLLTCLKCLDSHRSSIIPESFPDLPKLSMTEFTDKLETGPVNLPVVPANVR